MRKMNTLVPQHLSPTGVGIAWEHNTGGRLDLTFFVLCPLCPGFLTYSNSKDPNLGCSNCGKVHTSFPGIPSTGLRHGGPRYQVFQTSSFEATSTLDDGQILGMLDEWIELWTGLTDIEISITV